MLVIWLSICLGGYFLTSTNEFYILAGFVGLVMGGIQSQSRSTFSKLLEIGEKDVTSYFSFYDITEKLAIVIGTFVYGFIEHCAYAFVICFTSKIFGRSNCAQFFFCPFIGQLAWFVYIAACWHGILIQARFSYAEKLHLFLFF